MVSPEKSELAEEMKQGNHDYEEVLIEIVETGQHDGTLVSAAPAWLVASGILGMVGWTSRWFVPRESEISRTFVGTLVNGLVVASPRAGSGDAVAAEPGAAAPPDQEPR